MHSRRLFRRPGAGRQVGARLALGLLAAAAAARSPAGAPDGDAVAPALRVLKAGADVAVRSGFGPGLDLVRMMTTGLNGQVAFGPTRLVAAASPFSLAAAPGDVLIHDGAGDTAPWHLYGTALGGDGALEAVIELDCPGHGFGPGDIGSQWNDAGDASFFLVEVLDTIRLRFLSRNTARGDAWAFKPDMDGRFLTGRTRAISLGHTGYRTAAWRPVCRIVRREVLADGCRAIEDGVETRCRFLEIVDAHDLLHPAGLLEHVIRNRDPHPDPSNPDLPAVLRNRIAYRLYPGGALVIEHEAQALQSFTLDAMGFVQAARLAAPGLPVRRYAIPKTRPFRDGDALLRFDRFQEFPAGLTNALRFSAEAGNVADPENLPDRVIQLLGPGAGTQAGEVGFALGYSLLDGLSRPATRAAQCGTALVVQPDGAVELRALDRRLDQPVPAGATFRCLAYRQYFNPAAAPPAAAVYAHPQGADLVVYAHYLQPVEQHWIPLPPGLAGRPVEIIEPSDSLALASGGAVTPRGVALTVTDPAGGTAVLRVPGAWDPGPLDTRPAAR